MDVQQSTHITLARGAAYALAIIGVAIGVLMILGVAPNNNIDSGAALVFIGCSRLLS